MLQIGYTSIPCKSPRANRTPRFPDSYPVDGAQQTRRIAFGGLSGSSPFTRMRAPEMSASWGRDRRAARRRTRGGGVALRAVSRPEVMDQSTTLGGAKSYNVA